jgi:quercetin dioxygenase-like cupin family protein
MSDTYYIGDFRKDAVNGPNRGWIVGTFMPDVPRKNDELEIKYWEFKAGEDTKHPMKISSTIECVLILKGKTKCLVDGEEKTLKAGDYIVIKPGTPSNAAIEILEDVVAVTIKAPSDPAAKTVVTS